MWPWLPNLDGPVPTYYLLISLSFVVSILWIIKRAKNAQLNLNPVIDLLLTMMVAGFVGARLFQVLYEDPRFYISNPTAIFKFWQGGFVFYGGFLGALVAAVLFYKWKNYDFWRLADVMAPPLALGYSIGRWGCFFAGCCYGKLSNAPWAITFPQWSESPAGVPLHPTQIYSSLTELISLFILLVLQKKPLWAKNKGVLFGTWLIFHGFGRVFVEQFRGDFRGENVFNLSISTWISFIIIIGGAVVIAKRKNVSTTT